METYYLPRVKIPDDGECPVMFIQGTHRVVIQRVSLCLGPTGSKAFVVLSEAEIKVARFTGGGRWQGVMVVDWDGNTESLPPECVVLNYDALVTMPGNGYELSVRSMIEWFLTKLDLASVPRF